MDIDTILDEFGAQGRFPEAAIVASLEARGETAPLFLSILERAADPAGLDKREERAVFLIVHVLAEMGETRAYPPLLRLLGSDEIRASWMLGDAITETLAQILIAVFDGDLAGLIALMENEDADEFIRDAAFSTWTYLVLEGVIDRNLAHRYLMDFGARQGTEAGNFVWNGWSTAIALLGFDDLMPLVRKACDDDRVEPMNADYDDYVSLLERTRSEPREQWLVDQRLCPFDDTIGRLHRWAGFNPQPPAEEPDEYDKWDDLDLPALNPETVTNPYRHIGRNDPCPCGSGKKFKKCCLQ